MAITPIVSSLIGLVASVRSVPVSAVPSAAQRRPDPGPPALDPANVSRSLAIEWLTTLADRPFRPSAVQLGWVDAGDLVAGEARPRRMRVAAARFAGLFADHVAGDMAVEGGPGAYALVWQCAREAFITSVTAGTPAGRDLATHGPHA